MSIQYKSSDILLTGRVDVDINLLNTVWKFHKNSSSGLREILLTDINEKETVNVKPAVEEKGGGVGKDGLGVEGVDGGLQSGPEAPET